MLLVCATTGMKEVLGGYKILTIGQLANLCAARMAHTISFAAMRVYLACHEQKATRTAVKGSIRYTHEELHKLLDKTTVGEGRIAQALKELENANLLTWSETSITFTEELQPEASEIASELHTDSNRPIPIPRRLLRSLIRHTKPSEVIAALAHCARCLFKQGKKINPQGLVKASWVSGVFGISERAVHAARKWLIGLKFLIPVEVNQHVLNRFGGCFRINLKQGAEIPPRKVRKEKKREEFAPPYKQSSCTKSTNNQYIKTSTNQTLKRPPKQARPGFWKNKSQEPDIRDIRGGDLKQLSSVLILYQQAVKAGWLKHSEANLRNFASAAVRAQKVCGNAARIFVGIVKKGLWHYVTNEQEDRALTVLKRYREKHPEMFEFEFEPKQGRAAGDTSSVKQQAQAKEVTGLVGNLVSALGV